MENQKTEESRTLLLVTAHPDDDTLIGGTIAKLVVHGWNVYEFICTDGKNGKPNLDESDEHIIPQHRLKESRLFCHLLGAKEPYIYKNQNTFLSVHDDIVIDLVRYMRSIRPDVIVLLNKADYHFEHIIAHQIGLRAAEIAFRSSMLELGPKLTGGIILQTDGLNVLANPLVTFNITDFFEKKTEASSKAYGERLGDYLLRFDAGLAQMRGGRLGYGYAETFDLVHPEWYKFTPVSAKVLEEFTRIGSI